MRKISRWRLIIAAAIVAGLVELGLRKLNLSAIESIDIAWWYVLFALIANFASVLAKATVWKATLDTVPDLERTRYRDVVPALFIGFLLNTVLLARVGEIARVAVLRRRLAHRGIELDASVAAGTVLAEQLMMGAALVIVLVATAFVTSAPSWAFRGLIGLVVVLAILALALAAMTLLSRFRRRSRPSEADLARAWWSAALIQIGGVAHGLSAGLRIFRDPKPAGNRARRGARLVADADRRHLLDARCLRDPQGRLGRCARLPRLHPGAAVPDHPGQHRLVPAGRRLPAGPDLQHRHGPGDRLLHRAADHRGGARHGTRIHLPLP